MNFRLAFVRYQVLGRLYQRLVPLGERGPIVSFSFDDFPRTAYSVGGGILEGLGVRGTYYAAVGLMNSSNELGEQSRPDDLRSLLESGHELASHTFAHISCHAVSIAAFLAEVNRGQDALAEMTGVRPSGFAYPFGDVTLQAKKTLGPKLTSSRGIFPGFNGPAVDLNLLRANRLYGDRKNLPKAEKLITENARRKSWLIFFTHDIRPQPSPWGCTPELFESVAGFAVRSGSRILTIQEALTQMGVARVDAQVHAYGVAG